MSLRKMSETKIFGEEFFLVPVLEEDVKRFRIPDESGSGFVLSSDLALVTFIMARK
jgi:hypothetical protein